MSKKIFAVIGVALFTFSVVFTVQTYSYFASNVTGSGYITFASWSFTANGESTSFTTDLGELYPGIDRSYQVRLSAIGSDVPVEYTVLFNYPNDIPANLKFYKDSAKQQEINLDGGSITGTLAAGTETVITIYYDWPYGSTAEDYFPGNAWFNMTISGHQKNPNEGA